MSFWKFAIRIVVGVSLLYFLLTKHELEAHQVFQEILKLSPAALLGAIAVYLLGQLLCACRWAALARLAGYPVGFMQAWPVYFSGMFFNVCLPTSIGGDVIRVVGMSRQTGSKSAALASVFMDRNVGLSALLLIGGIASIPMHATVQATLFGYTKVVPLWPLFLLLFAGYAAANVLLFNDRLCNWTLAKIGHARLGVVGDKLQKLHLSLGAYRQPLNHYAWTFALSLVYQASEIFAVVLLAWGMDIPALPWIFFALVPFQAVASLLPVTLNGMGVREYVFCAVLMGQLGPSYKDEAMALSLVFFFGVMIVSSLIGGVVYIVIGFKKPTEAELGENGQQTQ